MALLQQACMTYDTFAHMAGKPEEGQEILAPIFHTVTRAALEITLTADGGFLDARRVDKKEPKIVIPVTAESAGRTSGACAHPLCDQLGYLAEYDEEKHRLYLEQLVQWAASPYTHPIAQAVLRYIQGGTILSDLLHCGCITVDEKGCPEDEKLLVRWVVNGLPLNESGQCWTNKGLMDAFIAWYQERLAGEEKDLCMISGEFAPVTEQHPKGVIALNGNAKLISANDKQGFTYRGRFAESRQAATVSYVASQKAHSALRWLVADQSVSESYGGRTFLCWNPAGHRTPHPGRSLLGRRGEGTVSITPTDYREKLQKALAGWREILPDGEGVVIAAFDAATTGRLALTYYNELRGSDFLQRMKDWEDTFCWPNGPFGVQSPTLYQLVNCAFGVQRGGRLETDERILRQHIQQLMDCRISGGKLPTDIAAAVVKKAGNLQIYEKNCRAQLLFTACAVIRKYRKDHLKEEWELALDRNNRDRSYLFGRLLALAEATERAAYSGEDRDGREPNAIRFQQIFSQRPMYAWGALETKLRPYRNKLSRSAPGLARYFEKEIMEVTDKLNALDVDLDTPLEDIYLLGYYHQKAYRKENDDTTEEE